MIILIISICAVRWSSEQRDASIGASTQRNGIRPSLSNPLIYSPPFHCLSERHDVLIGASTRASGIPPPLSPPIHSPSCRARASDTIFWLVHRIGRIGDPTPDKTIHLKDCRCHPDQSRSAIDPVSTLWTATTSTALTFWTRQHSYATSTPRQRSRSRPCADSERTAAQRHQPRPPRDIMLLVRVLKTSPAACVTIAAMAMVLRSWNLYRGSPKKSWTENKAN